MSAEQQETIELDPECVAAMQSADASLQLIDVREPYEREAGHIADTRHLELVRLSGEAATIERERPVVFYCRVGSRSLMAAQAFRAAGYEAYSMAGGLRRWAQEGQPALTRGRHRGRSLVEEAQMEASSEYPQVKTGEGYAVANLEDLGDGPGFRKVRKGLGVTAFGVNAIVMPPGIESGAHFHDEQEELYFVHRGAIEMEFGDGAVHELQRGRHRACRREHDPARPQRRRRRRGLSAAPAARTATSAATAACPRARSSAFARCTTSGRPGRLSVGGGGEE